MAFDKGQPKDIDLDSTDRLPILEGVSIDEDVEDDATRLEFSATMPGTSIVTTAAPDYRPGGLDLPSLAESVRSVEERFARQNADYEALNRLYERARDAQLAAGTRADALASELGAAHSSFAVEQHRVRELQAAVAEKNAAAEQARARAEEAMRESERAQGEARTLREALVARDASIAQALHSLGERDAQLFALQREHAKVVPDLEARSQASARLDREVKEAKERAQALVLDLQASRQSVAELTERVSRAESELKAERRELAAAKLQAESYLETLRTRDWRSGFNQNMFREWDDRIADAQSGRGALQSECDRLKLMAAAMNAKITEQNATIEKLNAAKMNEAAALAAAKMSEAAALAKKAQETQEIERARAALLAQIAEANGERKRVEAELAASARDVAELRSQIGAETQRAKDSIAAAEAVGARLAARIEALETEAKTHEEEMTVLMAHLNEARRPVQAVQADLKRVSDELAQKTVALEQLSEENRTLRTSLERTRGQLEERDLLIRRLERSASNNANVLGRLQTSIERLGGAPAAAPAGPPDYVAELVRIDCEQPITFVLARRTRIGRAPGCELQIDSQSVSRNHAMILKSARELIVEDLNSTNGVLVNGRKVTRHLLTDGDVLTVGEIQFRCVLKFKASEGAPEQPGQPVQAQPVQPGQGQATAQSQSGPVPVAGQAQPVQVAAAATPSLAGAVTGLSELRPGDAAKGEPGA
jgi:predicted  nucleic acid-binding Zn-ribbon protein